MNRILWEPKNFKLSNLYQFQEKLLTDGFLPNHMDYKDFQIWTKKNSDIFWREFLRFSNFKIIGSDTPTTQPGNHFNQISWFPNTKTNFAENILRKYMNRSLESENSPCIISFREGGMIEYVSPRELVSKTLKFRNFLKNNGVKAGTRVVASMPNIPETIYFMLASTSLGAVFSSSSPDFGTNAIYDRFGQLDPEVILITDSYQYKGKKIDKLNDYKNLISRLPSLKKCIVVPFYSSEKLDTPKTMIRYEEVLSLVEDSSPFDNFSFSHPVYTMFSSGTTGLPKCIIQGAGVLLNHLKEQLLHVDLRAEDTLFYFTTCGWMMWNWMVSSLAIGSRLVLFEGSPFFPGPETLWTLAKNEKISVFGTSAGYLAALEKSGFNTLNFNLPYLRTILSTGSPLLPEQFDFVYSKISPEVQLSSISGGTDLNGCFVLGNPYSPVRRGEIQGAGLGMSVEIWDEFGNRTLEKEGELVCTQPFPSMPLGFGNDPDGRKYSEAYFSRFPGVWRHGDYGIEKESGGFVILGRSDATLNPGGIRIGTAEIYRVVEKIPGIEDSIVVGVFNGEEERVYLFIKLKKQEELTEEFEKKVRDALKTEASPRHIPSKIFSVPEIPYTRNLKKVELILKNLFEGKPITNRESLHNPEILDFYINLKL